jgi:hypothetical protein
MYLHHLENAAVVDYLIPKTATMRETISARIITKTGSQRQML